MCLVIAMIPMIAMMLRLAKINYSAGVSQFKSGSTDPAVKPTTPAETLGLFRSLRGEFRPDEAVAVRMDADELAGDALWSLGDATGFPLGGSWDLATTYKWACSPTYRLACLPYLDYPHYKYGYKASCK